jgi:ATP-dependent exoDNAse (exonuclease V) beta subunit
VHVPDDLPLRAMSATAGEQLTLAIAAGEHEAASTPPAGSQHERTLTAEQAGVIERRQGALLLSAGAGTGKTAVLVERFVRAVLVDGIAPPRILAITFTERAAGELSQRLRQRFLELDQREQARDVEAAFVGTFHTFCARLLRLNALAAGVRPDFKVLDETRATRLRGAAFEDALAELVRREGDDGARLLAAYGASRLQEMLLGAYAELRSRGADEPRLPARAGPGGESAPPAAMSRVDEEATAQAFRACALLDALMVGFGRRYDALKRARGGLDFDDLELRARGLLAAHEPIREGWRERLELLMVDELQDVNPRQLALLHALERDNLFTVGDELQSIYGFRHADVGLFRARRAELAGHDAALELTYNFRARPELLQAINAVFAPRFGARYAPLQAGRGGDARCAQERDPAVELLLTDREWARAEGVPEDSGDAQGASGWRRAEAQMLAQRVAELIGAGEVRAKDVVVLLRATTALDVYAQALEEHGLATLSTVGGFWSQQEVRDLVSYLRVLANPLDELALYGTLASPLVGLSGDALALIARAGQEWGVGAWEAARRLAADRAAVSAREHERLAWFCELLGEERRERAWAGVAGALRRVLAASGYQRHLLALPAGERRIADVRKLIRAAARFEREEGGDLRGFLEHAAHAEQAPGHCEPRAPVADEELDAVRLMTIHAAKGLEFPVVCVAELGARPNARTPDLLVDGRRMGLRLARLGSPDALPVLDFEALRDERRRAQEEEEDRILYVALTRARERLLLSGVVSFKRLPQPKAGCAPIEWLAPALVEDLERRLADACEPGGRDREPEWVAEGAAGRVRCWLNAPPTLGRVLREGPLRPLAHALTAGAAPVATNGEPAGRERAGVECSPSPGDPVAQLALAAGLSYTALTQLERCGYRYYLESVLQLPEAHPASGASEQGSGGRARGKLLHRLLESFDFAGDAPIRAEQVAHAARELGEPVVQRDCAELAALLGELRGSELAERLALRGVRREQPFAFVFDPEQPMISGVIDALLVERDGRYLVVDYKSDRVGAEEDLDALVEREYDVQRLIYALAALRDGARAVEVVHWFVHRPHEGVSSCFGAAQTAALEAQLARRVHDARGRGYAVSEHPHRSLCSGCPGRGTLCSYSERETQRAYA